MGEITTANSWRFSTLPVAKGQSCGFAASAAGFLTLVG